MAYREFLDSDSQSWRVWSTVPSLGSRLRGGFDQGWLTFERTSADKSLPLRRLVPIPDGWETAADEELERLCRSADEVARPVSRRASAESTESTEAASSE
jgi:hypothetical protein